MESHDQLWLREAVTWTQLCTCHNFVQWDANWAATIHNQLLPEHSFVPVTALNSEMPTGRPWIIYGQLWQTGAVTSTQLCTCHSFLQRDPNWAATIHNQLLPEHNFVPVTALYSELPIERPRFTMSCYLNIALYLSQLCTSNSQLCGQDSQSAVTWAQLFTVRCLLNGHELYMVSCDWEELLPEHSFVQ